jgi:hypothetical protein
MGRISCVLDELKEKAFRELVFTKFGSKRGAVNNALKQAVDEWMMKEKKKHVK